MEPLEVIKVRAEKVGFTFRETTVEAYDDSGQIRKEPILELEIPNGRKPRAILIEESVAPIINGADFEYWIFLGEHAAIFNTKTGVIEALLRGYGPTPGALPYIIQRLAQWKTEQSAATEEIESEISDGAEKPTRVLFVSESEKANRISAEICSASRELLAAERGSIGFRPRAYSLKISTNGLRGHDQALSFLKDFSTALFLDLDLTRQVTLGLQVSNSVRRIRRRRDRGGEIDKRPLRIPRLQYSQEAASLYTYGRSATGMPLLEFLAYYQVMEFYFPIYSRQELMQRARQELLDPRFDPTNDAHLARMLTLLGGGSKGFLAESEQLRATLRRCADDKGIEEFIKQDPDMEQFLTGKQEIKGVKSLNFNNRDHRLTDQVADRLYQIRCRIVHSKEDGGGAGAELLLPFGEEARKLSMDISLARHLAQKVLIAGANSANWN